MKTPKLLITHHAPDIDAITSTWLFRRFHPDYASAKQWFVNAGTQVTAEEAQRLGFRLDEVTHVDTGEGEFDHHQKDRGMLRTCATEIVYKHLCETVRPELKDDWALQQIVEYANMDDHFEDYFYPEPAHPRYLFALRGILHGLEFAGIHDDDSQLTFGMKCLDGIYAELGERKRAIEEMEKGQQFVSKWGKAIAVETSNQSVLRLAQFSGFDLVIQRDPKRGSYRVKAAPKPEIDLSALAEAILAKDKQGTWYVHAGRHMLINGSNKNKNQQPSGLSLNEIMELAKAA